MRSTFLLAALATLAAASPLQPRAVFKATTFNDISIAGGTAGNAQQEAKDVLAGLPTDLKTVAKADLDFLNSVNKVANNAETDAFNPAVEAATGDAADALQRGKIKNKVLKLTATVMKLTAQQAQGQNVTTKLTEEQKKLDTNIKTDKADAGKASTAVSFDGTIG